MLYGRPTSPAMPIVARLTPSCVSQACSTVNVSINGRPLENPMSAANQSRRAQQYFAIFVRRAGAHRFL